MLLPKKIRQYERLSIRAENDNEAFDSVCFMLPSGNKINVESFLYQPLDFSYDYEGIETIRPAGKPVTECRYTFEIAGKVECIVSCYDRIVMKTEIEVISSDDPGYIGVSTNDQKYFAFQNGNPFFEIGMNTVYPTTYRQPKMKEFEVKKSVIYCGMRQYERWFKKCGENGVNVVRIWLGHDYFSPDTNVCGEYNIEQFSKLDEIFRLAKKYGLRLKLTVEHFRYFVYDSPEDYPGNENLFHLFNKNLTINGVRCKSGEEWLTDAKWKKAWLGKIRELSKRYAGDTSVFAIELWNEMNAYSDQEFFYEWNREIAPEVRRMFPKNMVINSLGSYDGEHARGVYGRFPWHLFSFKQVHSYLDCGAQFKACRENLVAALLNSISDTRQEDMPLIVAETGAVSPCHSGAFRYYVSDNRGILFVDAVYTPVFAGCAGCGNIWHWDDRYVESKNLYRLFRPLSNLLANMPMDKQKFTPVDLSGSEAYVLVLSGKDELIGFVRNKSDSWQNVLRDLNEPEPVKQILLDIKAKNVEKIQIWSDEPADITLEDTKIKIRNLKYGMLFKAKIQ